MYLTIYVGAIAVLFLFIVMTMNVTVYSFRYEQSLNLDIYILYIGWLFLLLFNNEDIPFCGTSPIYNFFYQKSFIELIEYSQITFFEKGIELIGQNLYNQHIISFVLIGLMLLISMLGVILLTVSKQTVIRRQKIL